jgi:hypothetical protein
MAKKSSREFQGYETRSVTVERYVGNREFQRGFHDRAAGNPFPKFDNYWHSELGRQLANGIIARGGVERPEDLLRLSRRDQIKWFLNFVLDGTISS